MATTAQVKPQALKNIGNVPDWVRVKDKKDKDAPRTIHRRPTKPRVSTAHVQAPAVTTPTKPPVIPQPIIEEVKDPIENGVQSPPAGSKGILPQAIFSLIFSFIISKKAKLTKHCTNHSLSSQ